MEPRYMYPSPRGVHVAETDTSDDDPYRPPRRNRYSRSAHQTPRIRNVTWISSPESTVQTSRGPQTPWMPAPQVPSSPARRPPSPIPPSPAPTVGEHMTVDDIIFTSDDMIDPYRPQRQSSGKGLFKSLWKGLKKFAGYYPPVPYPYHLQPGSYGNQIPMPMPMPSVPSEGTQYVDPTPPTTEEQQDGTPYTSPYAQVTHLGSVPPGSQRASPVPSMDMPQPSPRRASMPVPSLQRSPYARPAIIGGTPAVVPGSLHGSPAHVPSVDIAPAITVVSPSIPPSPRPSPIHSARAVSPVMGILRHRSIGGLDAGVVIAPPVVEEGSQTLHEPAPILPPINTQLISMPVPKLATTNNALGLGNGEPASPSSLASTVARFRRLPWTSDAQITHEYIPADNPRSQQRRRVRQGAEPSWYNPRAEAVGRPAYLSEWDKWASMQSAAALNGKGRSMYPNGYVGFVYPPHNRMPTPVIP